MTKKTMLYALVGIALIASLGMTTGCNTVYGPHMGLFATPPIPVSPYFQDMLEDNAYEHERYGRVPIMGPLTAGGPCKAIDPPSEDEVIRALEKARRTEGGIPFLYTVNRNNVRIVVEPIADYIDPQRSDRRSRCPSFNCADRAGSAVKPFVRRLTQNNLFRVNSRDYNTSTRIRHLNH